MFRSCAGISARQDQRNLDDVAVLNISAALGELVRENRHGVYIAMLQKLLCMGCCRGFVEETVSINAFRAILELKRVPERFRGSHGRVARPGEQRLRHYRRRHCDG